MPFRRPLRHHLRHPRRHRFPSPRLHLPLVVALLLTTGCASYRADPVILADYRAAWQGRDPFAEPLRAYARDLASRGVRGGLGQAVFDPADGLGLDEGEIVALFFNPHLRATRLAARVPAAGAEHAGRWDDPSLSVDAERILAAVASPWTVAAGIGLTLPVSGRTAAERRLADTQADAARTGVAVAEWALLAELRERWVDWSATVESVRVTADFAREADGVAAVGERLQAAGAIANGAVRTLRLQALGAALRRDELAAQARRGELRLRTIMGLLPDAPLRLVPTLAAAGAPVPSTADASPEVRQRLADHAVAERRLRLEIRKQYPDLSLGLGGGRDEGENRVDGSIGFSIPLWNANRRGVAEAEAERAAARARAEASYEDAVAALAEAAAERTAAATLLAHARDGLAGLADAQIDEARRVADLGAIDAPLLLAALDQAWQVRLRLVELQARLARADHRLLALGWPFGDDVRGATP